MEASQGVIVLGATSSIVRAAAIELGKSGYDIILGARDIEENELIARDIEIRCDVNAWALHFDAEDFESHAEFFNKCRSLPLSGLAGVVIGFGFMDGQDRAQAHFDIARKIIDVNFTACVSFLEQVADYFEQTKDRRSKKMRPFIAVISSVAGDRGRQSNYIYGASKAALSAYLQGLRNRLHRSRVTVLTVKPGFVDTKMTFAMNLKAAAHPETVGKAVVRAARRKKDVVYLPWFWRYIMLIIRMIPEKVFKRLRM